MLPLEAPVPPQGGAQGEGAQGQAALVPRRARALLEDRVRHPFQVHQAVPEEKLSRVSVTVSVETYNR